MTEKAEFVMTYLLRLLNGQEYLLVAVSPDEVMSIPENGDIWTGKLFNGGSIQVPEALFMSVEPDRYRVTVDNGQGHKGFNLSEKEVDKALNDYAKRNEETGEVKTSWKSITDRKTGERIDLD
jgi:hypothetical protein